jgi:hypothetical protein
MQDDSGNGRCQVRVLVFAASLRRASLNGRLASLAATVVEEQGGVPDRATMDEFECPSYDNDVERDEVSPITQCGCGSGWRRPTPTSSPRRSTTRPCRGT